MTENLRLLFSILWFPSLGASFATGLMFIVTLGDYGEYFLWSLIAFAIATFGVLATSLN